MKGVTQVEVNPKQSKLTVVGYVDPDRVLVRVRHRKSRVLALRAICLTPYALGAYVKKATPGYVRNVVLDPQAGDLVRATSFEVKYTTAFSDENPNASIIM